MKKKILYNIYLYVTMILGFAITMMLIFIVPEKYYIDTTLKTTAFLMSITINMMFFAFLSSYLSDKVNSLK